MDGEYLVGGLEIVILGGSGFGIMVILVGIDWGYVSWEEGLWCMEKIVGFLEKVDCFKGVYLYWWNGEIGYV